MTESENFIITFDISIDVQKDEDTGEFVATSPMLINQTFASDEKEESEAECRGKSMGDALAELLKAMAEAVRG